MALGLLQVPQDAVLQRQKLSISIAMSHVHSHIHARGHALTNGSKVNPELVVGLPDENYNRQSALRVSESRKKETWRTQERTRVSLLQGYQFKHERLWFRQLDRTGVKL